MKKTMQLKKILKDPAVCYAIGVHDAISATIAQNAGFEVLWGSGLTISAAAGKRDCNELSYTDVCRQWEYMSDVTNIPLIADGDSGFGNFNHVRELVKKLNKIHVAGVCLEDKMYPKTNSFLAYNQHLCDASTFIGKIKAAQDTRTDENFCIIARTEALIAGMGVEEALDRAYLYAEQGIDGLVVHSKQSSICEIEAFCSRWKGSIPLILIPTKYESTPSCVYEELGISLVIWANQLFRSSLFVMKETASQLKNQKSCAKMNVPMVSVEDIFSLTNEEELCNAEKTYEQPRDIIFRG